MNHSKTIRILITLLISLSMTACPEEQKEETLNVDDIFGTFESACLPLSELNLGEGEPKYFKEVVEASESGISMGIWQYADADCALLANKLDLKGTILGLTDKTDENLRHGELKNLKQWVKL